MANDSLRTPLCVTYRAEAVACGIIFTAARKLKVRLFCRLLGCAIGTCFKLAVRRAHGGASALPATLLAAVVAVKLMAPSSRAAAI